MTTKAQQALALLQKPDGCTNAELAKVLGRSRANVKGYARRRWKLAMDVVKAETRYVAVGKPGDMVVPKRVRKAKPETKAAAKPVETKPVKSAKPSKLDAKVAKIKAAKGPVEANIPALAKLLPKVGGAKAAKKAKAKTERALPHRLGDAPASLRLKPIAKQEPAKRLDKSGLTGL
jgi:hypothetical protein